MDLCRSSRDGERKEEKKMGNIKNKTNSHVRDGNVADAELGRIAVPEERLFKVPLVTQGQLAVLNANPVRAPLARLRGQRRARRVGGLTAEPLALFAHKGPLGAQGELVHGVLGARLGRETHNNFVRRVRLEQQQTAAGPRQRPRGVPSMLPKRSGPVRLLCKPGVNFHRRRTLFSLSFESFPM